VAGGVISTSIVLLVLLSALMHAGWNYMVKASPDGQLDTVGLAMGGSALAACLLPFVPLPADASLPWLAITVFVHIGYFVALIETYRRADLSLAYPLMRGSSPVLVSLVAPLMGETVSRGLMSGILLVGLGIMLPAWIGVRRGAVNRTGLLFGMVNAVIIATYTVIDGIGVRLAGNAISYTLWLFFLDAWGIFAIAAWRRGTLPVLSHLRQCWRLALAGSVLTVGSYGIVLWAMSNASIPAVAALRETSVVFAALLGTWLLKERMGRWRMTGAALVAVGAVLIRWG